MKSPAIRVTLLILFVAAAGAAGYFVWMSELAARAESDAAERFDATAVAASRGILELRAAQQAYVAAGQGHEFWTSKASAALGDLRDKLTALRAQTPAPQAQTAIDTTLAILQDFEEVDRRAREYASSGQNLLASDLIFSDGLEMTGAALTSLDEARSANHQSRASAMTEARRIQLMSLGSCAGFALLIILLLTPAPKRPREPVQVTTPAAEASTPEPFDLALTLDEDADNFKAPPPPPPPPPPPVTDTTTESVTLGSIASLCTELGKVVDTRSLSSILERTAVVLNASGIVLWIADPDGHELSPIVAHGYSDQVLARMGTISRDAENVTAAAFRTGLVQTVKADSIANGAIAAPLVTPAGSVGVMAAEVRNEGERQGAKLAAAAIVAAQLATLVGPPASRSSSQTETPKAEIV